MHDVAVFDLDGTLSDPLVGIGRCLNHALEHFGHATHALKDLSAFIGPPLDETFKTLTGSTSDAEVKALVAKFRERYGDIGYSENVLYPGIPHALARLSAAGLPMGLCTSKRVDFAESILAMFDLRSHFSFVSGGEIGIHKWQQIETLKAQGRLSAASVMVGDRAVDMVAAHRNGLSAAGVLWGYGSHAELTNERPSRLFRSPSELHALAGPRRAPRIVPLDHRDPVVAERIHAAQMLAYAQEAALIHARHFPPLDRTPADVLSSAERYLGALLADELVGAVSIETDLQAPRMTIASLVVTPTHQRKGIGRLLLAAALHECRGSTVTVSTGAKNAPALALYGSLGFIECGRRAVGPEALSVIELRRPQPGSPLRPIAPGGH